MFEDSFKDGIEKMIDFKGVLAFIATIFQHHIPFQFNIESTILVNFNQGLVQGWKSMIFITLFCKFLLKKYKNESNYLDMTKFDALIRKRIMKKVLIELLNSKLQAKCKIEVLKDAIYWLLSQRAARMPAEGWP